MAVTAATRGRIGVPTRLLRTTHAKNVLWDGFPRPEHPLHALSAG